MIEWVFRNSLVLVGMLILHDVSTAKEDDLSPLQTPGRVLAAGCGSVTRRLGVDLAQSHGFPIASTATAVGGAVGVASY